MDSLVLNGPLSLDSTVIKEHIEQFLFSTVLKTVYLEAKAR
jgi:hypothetical protein